MKTYLDYFLQSINDNEGDISLVDDRSSYGRKQIRFILKQYIDWIDKFDIKPREKVILLSERNARSVIFFHALLLSDLIPVLIYRTLASDQINNLSKDFKKFTSKKDLASESIVLIPTIEIPPSEKSVPDFLYKFSNSEGHHLFATHTSGTTDMPKLITYTNKNITWAVEQYQQLYNLGTNRNVLFALPFHYCFGFIACCLSPLSLGGKIVLLSEKESDPEYIAGQIESNRVNILVINPFFYIQLCKIDLSKYDFSFLKVCDSGGEILPIEVIKKFEEQTNVLITEGYGLTETTSLIHFLTPDSKGALRLGSVGKPCSGALCRIVDQNSGDLPTGEIGELLVKGPMVIDSYDDPKYNQDAFINGWFKTGDLFYKDRDDYYFLVGRKKDAASVPNELHVKVSRAVPALIQLSNIIDLVYKFIDNTHLMIYVIPEYKTVETRKNIEKEIKKSLSKELREIVQVKFVDSVPRTATGKVQRRKLNQ
jgi:acyl-CoA synthetase (AMP-forming)/AMP-acid ligase II